MIDYHIHTDFADGEMSIEQIIGLARELGIEQIAITEHIRRQPTYNWFELRDAIRHLDKTVLVGVEAKVLDRYGTLDCPEDILGEADLVLGSVHGIGNVEWLLESRCDIIAHPDISPVNIKLFERCHKVLEINSKHRLSFQMLGPLIKYNIFSFGSDAHSQTELCEGQTYFREVIRNFPDIHLIIKEEK